MDRLLGIDRIDRRYRSVGKQEIYGVGGIASRVRIDSGVGDK